jgi:sugar phosphate isomerase/epimerase
MSTFRLQKLSRRCFLAAAGTSAAAAATMSTAPFSSCWGQDAVKKNRFRYALCNEMFGDMPLDKAFAFVAKCGYQGVEIAPFTVGMPKPVSSQRRAEIVQAAKKVNLEIVGLHWLLAKTEGFHLTTADADARKKTSAYFVELGQLCADLGGKIMVLGSPQQRNLAPGMTKEQGMKNAAECLQAAMPALEKLGVVVALEPLAPAETNFMNSAAEGVELMKLVNSTSCRLHLDCKAMSAEPTPIPELIKKYRDVFVHFHANDANRLGPGFGKLDFKPILQTLADIDYPGWVSVEPTLFELVYGRLARESIANLRRCEPKT